MSKKETVIAVSEPVADDSTKFLALTEGSDIYEAMQANLVSGEQIGIGDLTVVKVPASGGKVWSYETVEGDVNSPAIRGLLVHYQAYGVLWSSEEQDGDGKVPLLVTNDLRKAWKKGDDFGDLDEAGIEACRNSDGSYDWQKLPQNQWGSASKGKGKRCKEQRYLCILGENEAMPILVRVPPGSIKSVSNFMKKLTVPYFRAVVELSLSQEKSAGGIAYSQIKMKLVDTVDKPTGEKVKALYSTRLAEAIEAAAMSTPSSQDDLD